MIYWYILGYIGFIWIWGIYCEIGVISVDILDICDTFDIFYIFDIWYIL